MDPRFLESSLLRFRKKQWNDDELIKHIRNLINKSISFLEGWKVIDVFIGKDISKRTEELNISSYKNVKVILENPKNVNVEFNIKTPLLIKNQFFFIGGFLKIPLFQLIDFPIIYKDVKDQVRFRNNILSSSLIIDRRGYSFLLFGKKIPLEQVLGVFYEQDEILKYLNELQSNEYIEVIKTLLNDYYKECTEKEIRISNIGKHFSSVKNDYLKKGNNIVNYINIANELDYFTRDFMKTDCMFKEMLLALSEGPRSDRDMYRKRLRFTEYILSPMISKIHDITLSIMNDTSTKKINEYNISSNILIDNCNVSSESVSDIVRFNLVINPASELYNLFSCTLTGPNGFKKDNVPKHLRTLHESQYGILCPADTPDRSGCGVLLNLCPTTKINDNGTFVEPSDIITSYTTSLVPFIQNDDQTRLQMASSQTKQALLLKDIEPPMIKSGTEDAYLESSTFLYRAKDNGKVVCLNDELMIVVYDDGSGEVIKPAMKKLHLGSLDYMTPKKEEGEKFTKDEILCSSSFLINGEMCLGKNLLTSIFIDNGYNYEDAIIMSETASKKMTSKHFVELTYQITPDKILLSLSNDEYKPIPVVNDIIKKGETYAKLKSINLEDIDQINSGVISLKSPQTCKILSVHLFANSWNKSVNEYNTNISAYLENQTANYNKIISTLRENIDDDDINKFVDSNEVSKLNSIANIGKYYNKGIKINGILVKIIAMYEEELTSGDKVANRHGNKGIISRVVPDDQMPITEDGRRLEVIINPLGILSRMNVGQLYELAMSEILYNLKNIINSNDNNKYLLKVLKIIDKTNDKWVSNYIISKFNEDKKHKGKEYALNNLCFIIPQFLGVTPEDVNELMNITNSKYKQNIKIGDTIKTNISVGYMYFYKLVHRVREKMTSRSFGPYSGKTFQPLSGKSNKGGHRFGEMEVWAMGAHGSKDMLKDLLTVHADSVGLKHKYISGLLNDDLNIPNTEEITPQSLMLLKNYFKVLGIDLKE